MRSVPYLLFLLGVISFSLSDSQSPEEFAAESKSSGAFAQLLGIAKTGIRILQAQRTATVQLNNQLKESLRLLADLSLVQLSGTERERNFFQAVENEDEDFVLAWIRLRLKLDGKDPMDNQRTALHKAVELGYTSILKDLLVAGANPNEKDRVGETPLHMAAFKGYKEGVDLLVAGQANPNEKSVEGQTSLHLAVWGGNIEVVDRLIQAGANLNEKDIRGSTPLHYAVLHTHTEVLKALLRAGASNAVERMDGRTPLDLALEMRQSEMANILSASNTE